MYNPEERKIEEPWSSIVDLMSAFALVLFLAVMFFVINYNSAEQQRKQKEVQLLIKERALKKAEEARKLKERELLLKERELQRQIQKLRETQQNLLATQKEKEEAERAKLTAEEERKRLQKEKEEAERAKAEAERARIAAEEERKRLEEERKKAEMALKLAQIEQKKCVAKLQALMKEKEKILRSLSRVFASTSKDSAVRFDSKTGKISMKGDVLFATNQATLTPEGKKHLREVVKKLNAVLFKDGVLPVIEGIMIEGHADITGSEKHNWRLSAERALSALQYILSLVKGDPKKYKIYKKLLFAGAFGQSRPVYYRGKIDYRRSRRIEIKILFDQNRFRKLADELSR